MENLNARVLCVCAKVPPVPSALAEAPLTGVEGSSSTSSNTPDQPKFTSPVAPNTTSTKSSSVCPTEGVQDDPSQAEETGNDGSASADADKEREGTAVRHPCHGQSFCPASDGVIMHACTAHPLPMSSINQPPSHTHMGEAVPLQMFELANSVLLQCSFAIDVAGGGHLVFWQTCFIGFMLLRSESIVHLG